MMILANYCNVNFMHLLSMSLKIFREGSQGLVCKGRCVQSDTFFEACSAYSDSVKIAHLHAAIAIAVFAKFCRGTVHASQYVQVLQPSHRAGARINTFPCKSSSGTEGLPAMCSGLNPLLQLCNEEHGQFCCIIDFVSEELLQSQMLPGIVAYLQEAL